MANAADPNPYAPPETVWKLIVHEPPIRRRGWLRRLFAVQAIVIVCSLAAEAYEHESIVGSGPIFSLVGLVIAIVAFRQRHMLGTLFGLSALAFAGLVVVLINFNGWGPPEGDRPITIMAFVYSLMALPAAWFLFAWEHENRA